MCVAAVSQSVGSPAGQLMSPHTRAQVLEPAAVDEVTCSDVVTLTTSRQDEHLKIHVSEVSRQVFKVMEAVLLLQRRPFGDRNMNCCSCQNKKKKRKQDVQLQINFSALAEIKKILKFNIISHSPKKIGAFLVVLRQK